MSKTVMSKTLHFHYIVEENGIMTPVDVTDDPRCILFDQLSKEADRLRKVAARLDKEAAAQDPGDRPRVTVLPSDASVA